MLRVHIREICFEAGKMHSGTCFIFIDFLSLASCACSHAPNAYRWEVVMAGEAMHALAGTADRAPTDWCTVDEKTWALLDGDPMVRSMR